MASNTVIHDPSGDIDLSVYTEEERTTILTVLEKAKTFQQQEDNKFRQPMEGQLSKWTNYVRGWQYRWFTLDPESGMLDYYMEKDKIKQGPRGSVNLACAVVSPSDEDSFTFSVNAANGDIFKLRANNAKERQHWINSLRSVAQFHEHNMAQAAPPLMAHGQTLATSIKSNQAGGQTPTPAPTLVSGTSEPIPDDANQKSYFKGPQIQFHHVPAYVTDELITVRDMLHGIEDEQMVLIDQLEMDPVNEETVYPLDEHILVLKATSHSTLNSLHHCFSILQRKVAELQNDDESGPPDWELAVLAEEAISES